MRRVTVRRGWVVLAVISLIAAGAVHVVADLTLRGQQLDNNGIWSLHDAVPAWSVEPLTAFARSWVLPGLGVVVAVALVAAVVRRDWWAVVRSLVIVGVSVPLAVLLREHLLTRPDLGPVGANEVTMPSGHQAATTALAVALVLLLRGGARAVAGAVMVPVVAAAALGNVVGVAHRPADVVTAVLLVLGVTGLVLAVPVASDREGGVWGGAPGGV